MNKDFIKIFVVIFVACSFSFFGGCEKKEKVSEQPQAVASKKVDINKKIDTQEKAALESDTPSVEPVGEKPSDMLTPESIPAGGENVKAEAVNENAVDEVGDVSEAPVAPVKVDLPENEADLAESTDRSLQNSDNIDMVMGFDNKDETPKENEEISELLNDKAEEGKDEDKILQSAQDKKTDDIGDNYDPTGKIDPFVPLDYEANVVTVRRVEREQRVQLTPLEKVDLSQLTLTATILAPSGNRAMVTGSDGKGYVVTKGIYIGINSGRVTEILQDRIIVEEEVENIFGKISIRKRELKLQKPPGE